MEWMNRAGRPAQPGQTVAPSNPNAPLPHHGGGNNKKRAVDHRGFHYISSVVLLFSVTLLAAALIFSLMFFRNKGEQKFVNKDLYQAVFLNGGQVYFGKVRELNPSYMVMDKIYYLRVNQQVQPKQGQTAQQDISLVKLGCELHGPQDGMVINREQLVFWENLKSDGKVAKAVDAYAKANPEGQKCEEAAPQNNDDSSKQETTPNTNTTNNNTNSTP